MPITLAPAPEISFVLVGYRDQISKGESRRQGRKMIKATRYAVAVYIGLLIAGAVTPTSTEATVASSPRDDRPIVQLDNQPADAPAADTAALPN